MSIETEKKLKCLQVQLEDAMLKTMDNMGPSVKELSFFATDEESELFNEINDLRGLAF